MGGGQNLERLNVERPIFPNFEIANIKIKKNEFFLNNFISNFFFNFPKLFQYPKYLIIFDIVNIDFLNGKI